MKCDFVNEHIADLFDDPASPEEKSAVTDHIAQCDPCREAYEQYLAIAAALNTDISLPAGKAEIDAILSLVREKPPAEPPQPFLKPKISSILRIAASIAILLGITATIIYVTAFRNTATAAGTILEKSIRAMISLKTVSMCFSIRTSPADNFESIDPASGVSDFKIWKRFGKPSRWRFEKPGRTIIMDGSSQYMINKAGGYILQGGPGAGFAGWMTLVLKPLDILEKELIFAKANPSSCSVKESGNQLILTIRVAASGTFTNPWALNSSVPESNSRRVYRFDKQTRMLASMEIFVETGPEDVCVVKLTQTAINPLLTSGTWPPPEASKISAGRRLPGYFLQPVRKTTGKR